MSAKILDNVLETIGNTPLIRLHKVTEGIKATVLAKVEFFNPGGSVKDRIAIQIIEAAEKEGLLRPGGTIVEATSGNTGAGLAVAAALKGYKAVFTMPDKMSQEKIRLLKAFGADVIVCPTAVPPDSPESYYEVAKKIARETEGALLANQYFNPENPRAHYLTTGPEIWEQTDGRIDYFVAGLGTGGTVSGVGKFLKEKNPDIKVIGADPLGSILRDYFYTKKMTTAQPYKVEGIGEDILPGTLDFSVIDEIYTVTDKESFNTARRLAREEGLLVGGSSGTAAFAALQVARSLPKDKVVVVLFPDAGDRYLSKFYSDEWMKENRFFDIERVRMRQVVDAKGPHLPRLISVAPTDPVRRALALMEEYHISQLPVIQEGRAVGSIEESTLMAQVLEDNSLIDAPVERVMQEGFPVVDAEDSIDHAKALLTRNKPAVLVQELGQLIGIVTKVDLLDFMTGSS
jgi:cystathionine beta-synthase